MVRSSQIHQFLAVMVLAVLVAGCTPETTDGTNNASSSSAMMEEQSSSSVNGMEAEDTSAYRDGAYTAVGTYISPAGEEKVDVTVTLEDGVITDAVFNGRATNPGSVRMQGNFAAGYEAEVEGKSIDEVSLSVVNGSSLTPKGFMDALEKIKTEAAA